MFGASWTVDVPECFACEVFDLTIVLGLFESDIHDAIDFNFDFNLNFLVLSFYYLLFSYQLSIFLKSYASGFGRYFFAAS